MDFMLAYAIKLGASVSAILGYIALAVNDSVSSGSDALPNWLNVGTATVAVAGVVYLVKLLAKGDLVPEKRVKSIVKEAVDEYIRENS